MLSLLTLPFRLVFGILFALVALPFALLAIPFAILLVPFLLLRLLFKAALAVIVLPVVFVAVIVALAVGLAATLVAVVLPLLPIAFFVFCVWAVVHIATKPTYAR